MHILHAVRHNAFVCKLLYTDNAGRLIIHKHVSDVTGTGLSY